jgi:O-antigen/teichoic acid export membrane protein
MFEFGKWLAGSSMLTFASQQGDRLVLGHYLGTAKLGVYSIAVFLSGALGDVIARIASGVLFPAYSRVRTEGTDRLRAMYYKTRLATDALAMPALGALSVLGTFVVHLLYDQRYADAGWMLQVLTVRVALAAIAAPCQFCLFALGRTRDGFNTNLARVVWLAAAVPAGYHIAGVKGLVWAAALCEVPALLVLFPAFLREGLLRPTREVLAPAFYAAGVVLGLGMRQILHAFGWA